MKAGPDSACGMALILAAFLLSPGFAHGFGFPVPPAILDPKSYVSPSGHFTLLVDPSHIHGRGSATYRLSKDGREVWSGEKPFTLWNARVTDEGVVGGFAYSDGEGDSQTKGDFQVIILDQHGFVRVNHVTKRERVNVPEQPPSPVGRGVVMDDANDRFVIRVQDENVNRDNEAWWVYRLSTGARLTAFRPSDEMPGALPKIGLANMKGINQVELLANTPLTLVRWWHNEYSMSVDRDSTHFALMDLDGRTVWTLQLEKDAEIDMTGCRGGRFALVDRSAGQRIELTSHRRVTEDYVVKEVRRAPAPRRTLASSSPVILNRPLTHLGQIELRTPARSTPLPIQRVHDFVIDSHGKIAFVNENANTTRLELVDASGKTCGSISLDAVEGGTNSELKFAQVGGERFVVIKSTSEHGNCAGTAWWADFTTGKTTAIPNFDRSHIAYVAGFPDGRFAVGAWNCDEGITAFDAQGRRAWSQRSDPVANGRTLMRQSPKALTVTSTGEVVALEIDSKSVYRFDQNGRHLGTLDLAKSWGREPNNPTGIEADKAGGFIISDFEGSPPVVRMNADGSVRTAFQPRNPDGRATGTKVKGAPDGRLWTCDGHALLRLDEAGVVDRVLSDPPDPAQLERISALEVDPTGRIYAADWRTGAVHVFDPRGQFLRTCVPSPTDFERPLPGQPLAVSEDGHVYLGRGDLGNDRVGQYVHFLPDGTRQGIETLALDNIKQDWYLQPRTGNRWVVTYENIFLVDRAGALLKTVDRCPDRKWLDHPGEASVAPDGSLAVVARSAVNLYGPTGDPIRTIPIPTQFKGSHAPIAYNGKWVAIWEKSGVILFDCSSQQWQQFSLRSGVVSVRFGCHLALAPNGRELLLFYGGTTIVRYELPRA